MTLSLEQSKSMRVYCHAAADSATPAPCCIAARPTLPQEVNLKLAYNAGGTHLKGRPSVASCSRQGRWPKHGNTCRSPYEP